MLMRLIAASSLFGAVAMAAAGAPAGADFREDAPDGAYSIDNSHTEVMFKVNHLGISNFYGRFNKVSGKVVVDSASPAESLITLTIDAASVDTNDAGRDKHLKSADFFNTEEFATIGFESEKVTATGEKTLDVEGTLEMHGVKKAVTAKVERTGFGTVGQFGTRIGYEARFIVKRSDFGMNYMPGLLGDEVEILVSLEGVK